MDQNITILSLPVNFPSSQRASLSKEKSGRSVVTAATELTSSCRSGYSIGTNDDFDGFIEALEARYGHDDDDDATEEDEEGVLLKLMSYEQGREIIQSGAAAHDTTPTEIQKTSAHEASRFDSLAIKVARLEKKHKMRKMEHQARILHAKKEYLECLEALVLSTTPEKELTGEFLTGHGLVWKEVEIDRNPNLAKRRGVCKRHGAYRNPTEESTAK